MQKVIWDEVGAWITTRVGAVVLLVLESTGLMTGWGGLISEITLNSLPT